MAILQEGIARRWPVTVFAIAGLAGLAAGELLARGYFLAAQGYSQAADGPIRIVRQAGSVDRTDSAFPVPGDRPAEGKSGLGLAASMPEKAPEARQKRIRVMESAATPSASGNRGLLPIEFDLANLGADGPAIEIRKAVRLNGADVGEARIRVDANSTLSIARAEFGRLLIQSGSVELSERLTVGGPFISFDEMRRQGIEVRYDPVRDRILVSS